MAVPARHHSACICRGCKRPVFQARLRADGPLYTTPEDLIAALAQDHTVTANVVSRMTSFGKCLCVKQPDGSYVSIPFNIPMRTGVKRLTPGAEGWEVCSHVTG